MTRTTRFLLAALGVVAVARDAGAQATANEWTIDPNHTSAQFAVRHLLVSTVRAL